MYAFLAFSDVCNGTNLEGFSVRLALFINGYGWNRLIFAWDWVGVEHWVGNVGLDWVD
jgi:hypothetical protein